jgi:UDP-N-acetylmuramyl pentapeptide synthase
MLELGPGEARFHEEIGTYARECGVDVLICVGPLAARMGSSFDGDGDGDVHVVDDAAAAAALTVKLVAPGDTVLVKGSRGVGLEVVAQALREARDG